MGVKKGDTVALYLLNCPQYVIAYFGALKVGAKITPISPVYTSQEVKHQIEDSEARAVVCEEILYDNVERSGANLDHVILTDISDYLPPLKKLFGKNALSKAYSGMAAPSQEHMKRQDFCGFKIFSRNTRAPPLQWKLIPEKTLQPFPTRAAPPGCPRRP
jgi:long-chain acyl-CoA synthetase